MTKEYKDTQQTLQALTQHLQPILKQHNLRPNYNGITFHSYTNQPHHTTNPTPHQTHHTLYIHTTHIQIWTYKNINTQNVHITTIPTADPQLLTKIQQTLQNPPQPTNKPGNQT